MKIGVVTFHRAINYGALLQTYALQEALNNMNIDNEVIDYRCKVIEDKYWKFVKKQSIASMIKNIMLYRRESIKKDKFMNFIKENLNVSSEAYYSKESLRALDEKYDYFITGSDQVWSHKITNFDTAYFLDFVKEKSKKCSYAASFGMSNLDEKYKEKYKELLEDFNKVSVREEQGRNIIKKLVNRNVDVVLDPTFLLSKSDWDKIAIKPNEKNYILIYIMKWSDSLFSFAENLSAKTGCSIKYITNGVKKPIKGEYITTAGIEEFVGLFANARYVITNSFHGTAFSIIMNKDFFIELQEPPASNDRLENIMDTYNLRSREIIDGKNNYENEQIDYELVNEKLNFIKNQSLKFLKSIVQDEI